MNNQIPLDRKPTDRELSDEIYRLIIEPARTQVFKISCVRAEMGEMPCLKFLLEHCLVQWAGMNPDNAKEVCSKLPEKEWEYLLGKVLA